MKIAVLGGTRFIGPFIVRAVVRQGHQVEVYHRGKAEGFSTLISEFSREESPKRLTTASSGRGKSRRSRKALERRYACQCGTNHEYHTSV